MRSQSPSLCFPRIRDCAERCVGSRSRRCGAACARRPGSTARPCGRRLESPARVRWGEAAVALGDKDHVASVFRAALHPEAVELADFVAFHWVQ